MNNTLKLLFAFAIASTALNVAYATADKNAKAPVTDTTKKQENAPAEGSSDGDDDDKKA